MYIGDWMERGQRYYPEATAVIDVAKGDAGRFSYRAMNERANRLAHWLRAEGQITARDRVAILALNGVEYLDALFACGKLGAVFVPLNWRCHPGEQVELIELTGPKVLIFGDEFAASARVLATATNSPLRHFVRIPAPGTNGAAAGAGAENFVATEYESALADSESAPVSNPDVDAEDILALLFTGGTTGLPKAARISYRMIAWNTLNTVIHELQRGDVTITHTPMFHTGGLLVYTLPLLTLGGTVVIMRKWTAAGMLDIIERERVSLLFCVPAQYRMMMDHERFASARLASLRFLTSGGAPLPAPIIERYGQVHDVVFKQGFGMTEFGPGVFSMAPEYALKKIGSIGRPNYFIDARVVDDRGTEVSVGKVGELVLKGPSMCSGYFGRPAGSVTDASESPVDERGYFHTGDLARRDADGFFFITDRKKDMFISGGENVYPAEIERVLHRHPAVAQCAVIGVPDARWGEVGKAFVVLVEGDGQTVTGEALIEHCRAHLARYKVPKTVEFMVDMPMSMAGKVLKRALREWAASAG